MLPSWAGKVPTDQKSVVNWVPMDWGMCSLSAGGARNTLPPWASTCRAFSSKERVSYTEAGQRGSTGGYIHKG